MLILKFWNKIMRIVGRCAADRMLVLSVIVSILLGTMPFFIQPLFLGNRWDGVFAEVNGDSYYYLIRAQHSISDDPFMSSPYIPEHRGSLGASFSVVEWLNAWPFALGWSPFWALLANTMLWSALFGAFVLTILRRFGVPDALGLLGVILAYLAVYTGMVRPLVMQTIFPLFVFFLITLLYYLESPSRQRALFLGVMAGIASYFYTFLFQVEAAILVVLFLATLFRGKKTEIFFLVFCGVTAMITLIPFAIMQYVVTHASGYADLLLRYGIVMSHLPSIHVVNYGRWAVIGIGLVLILAFYLRKSESEKYVAHERITQYFFVISGAGIFLAITQSIITGVDIQIAEHVGRFVFLWAVLLVVYVAVLLYREQKKLTEQKGLASLICALLFVLSLGVLSSIAREYHSVFLPGRSTLAASIQNQGRLYRFLNTLPQGTVLAPLPVVNALPLYTYHGALFASDMVFSMISRQELDDRLAIHHYLLGDPGEGYEGVYRAMLDISADFRYKTERYWHDRCGFIGIMCGRAEQLHTTEEEQYIKDGLSAMDKIGGDVARWASIYGVTYIIVGIDSRERVKKLIPDIKELYADNTYVVYKLAK